MKYFLTIICFSLSFTQTNLLTQAKEKFTLKQYETAIDLLEDFLDDHERNKEARLLLAKSHRALGHYDHASDELETLTEFYPNNSTYLQLLWDVYIQEGEDSGPIGRISITGKIFDTIQKLAELEPDSIRFQEHAIFGLLNVSSAFGGDEERGLEKLAKLKRRAPYEANQIYFDRYLKQDQIDKAKALLTEIESSADGKTSHYKLYHWYGQLLQEKGRLSEAIEVFEKRIQLMPNNASYHYMLGVAYIENKQTEKAKDQFKKALLIDPTYSEAQDALDELGD